MAKKTRKYEKAGRARRARVAAGRLKLSLDHPRVLLKRAYREAKKLSCHTESALGFDVAEEGWLAVSLVADAVADAVGRKPGGGPGAREQALGDLERAAGLKTDVLAFRFHNVLNFLQHVRGSGYERHREFPTWKAILEAP